ncbi:hypothetical protein [Clostridium lundense]|uniref:hypothetical protein n=1 Tax=Clostridium lundense TaxID=319475 RepID=UPI000AC562DD|nr:hypothetical protein [Clostridium lundense]
MWDVKLKEGYNDKNILLICFCEGVKFKMNLIKKFKGMVILNTLNIKGNEKIKH